MPRPIVRRAERLAKDYWKRALLIVLAGLVAYWVIWPNDSPEWTGFGAHAKDETVVREKKLWDWLGLLIIPAVLAAGAWWLNKTEKETDCRIADETIEAGRSFTSERIEADRRFTSERIDADRQVADDKQQEDRLQKYFDRITELLLREGLRTSKPKDEVRSIARTRTLSTLRTLDATRKGLLLRFLQESGLTQKGSPIVNLAVADLSGADLNRADLSGANLDRADLNGAHLHGADLRGSHLSETHLSGAHLSGAHLNLADLSGADLRGTDLRGADLSGAILNRADLRRADLSGANLSGAHLRASDLGAANLSGAHLSGADVREANLRAAHLRGAHLRGTDLRWASLREANLSRATVTDEQLFAARTLEDAIMPDGRRHE